MKTLLVVAHGSRVKESNEEIIKFSKKIEEESNGDFFVSYAFLELSEPSIYNSLKDCVEKNNSFDIEVLPYFLAKGRHVKEDIPNEIEKFKTVYKNVTIKLLPHLGQTEGLSTLILNNYCK